MISNFARCFISVFQRINPFDIKNNFSRYAFGSLLFVFSSKSKLFKTYITEYEANTFKKLLIL